MKITTLTILAAMSFVLTGCFEEKIEETKTVEFYKTNETARKEKITLCSDNPGELGKTPNCINAIQAEKILSAGEKRDIDLTGFKLDILPKK